MTKNLTSLSNNAANNVANSASSAAQNEHIFVFYIPISVSGIEASSCLPQTCSHPSHRIVYRQQHCFSQVDLDEILPTASLSSVEY